MSLVEKYPEHAKLALAYDKFTVAFDFIEWCDSQDLSIGKLSYSHDRYEGDSFEEVDSTEALAYRYAGVDPKVLNTEKSAMKEEMTNAVLREALAGRATNILKESERVTIVTDKV